MEDTKMLTIYVGGESTMKDIANRGHIRVLNRKTMRWQKFGEDAIYKAIKDPDPNITTGWMCLCSRDVKKEAINAGFVI